MAFFRLSYILTFPLVCCHDEQCPCTVFISGSGFRGGSKTAISVNSLAASRTELSGRCFAFVQSEPLSIDFPAL